MFFVIFGMQNCPACIHSKLMLDDSRYRYFEVDTTSQLSDMLSNFNYSKDRITVPQIFTISNDDVYDGLVLASIAIEYITSSVKSDEINTIHYIGGSSDLARYIYK